MQTVWVVSIRVHLCRSTYQVSLFRLDLSVFDKEAPTDGAPIIKNDQIQDFAVTSKALFTRDRRFPQWKLYLEWLFSISH